MNKWTLFALLAAAPAWGQTLEENLAQIRVRVTDENGNPITRAQVMLSTFNTWVPARQGAGREEYETASAATDESGCVNLSLKGSSGRYQCVVLPIPGFQFNRGVETTFTNAVAGRWEPWPQPVQIVLKRTSGPGEYAKPAGVSPQPPVPLVSTNAPAGPGSKDPSLGRVPTPFMKAAPPGARP